MKTCHACLLQFTGRGDTESKAPELWGQALCGERHGPAGSSAFSPAPGLMDAALQHTAHAISDFLSQAAVACLKWKRQPESLGTDSGAVKTLTRFLYFTTCRTLHSHTWNPPPPYGSLLALPVARTCPSTHPGCTLQENEKERLQPAGRTR